jgi:hypothetical protein
MRPQKITFRQHARDGRARILVYCADFHCSPSVALRPIAGPTTYGCQTSSRGFVCRACGRRGADIRPDFNWNKPPTAAMGYR